MEPFVEPLPGDARPEEAFRWLAARAQRRGLSPPAALTGDWFHGSAVLVPSVDVAPTVNAFTTVDVASNAAEDIVGGGWIGYLSYPRRPGRLPTAAWGWTDHVLRRDRRGQWWFEALSTPSSELVTELGAAVRSTNSAAGEGWEIGEITRPDAAQHRDAVRDCRCEIAAGEIFQANICCRFTIPFTGDPLDLFAAASSRLRPARAACVAGDWGAVVSLSPELFLARHGEHVRTCPIKGTLPRRGPADDANAQRLRESAKDVAENVMILDMARNDLGRVATAGGVTVPRLLDVQPHPGVWHLVSEVHADLPENTANSTLLQATFPPASITGAPKPRALEIIDNLETQPRGVYCGTVGMVSPLAGMELNVAIRTLEYADGVMHLGVGGGITSDSDPEQEWQECLTKAAPLLSLLENGQRRASSTAS